MASRAWMAPHCGNPQELWPFWEDAGRWGSSWSWDGEEDVPRCRACSSAAGLGFRSVKIPLFFSL